MAWSRTLDLQALDQPTTQGLLTALPALNSPEFSRGDLEDALRWLIQSGNFDSAQYTSADAEHFTLLAGKTKRIHSILLKGNNSIGDTEIRNVFGVSESGSFEPETLLEAGKKVQAYYKDQGFMNAVIDLEFVPVNNSDYDVSVKVSEHVQSKFADIRINTSNKALEAKLQSRLSDYIGQPFTPIAVKLMQRDLQNYFVNKNYFRAETGDPSVTFSQDESQVTIEFKIDHPEAYFIDPPESGRLPFNKVEDALGLNEFKSTSPNLSQELSSKIKAFYISQGYARAEVNVQDKEGIEAFHRRLQVQVVEGPRVDIEKVEFTGRFSQSEKHYINTLYDLSSPVMSDKHFVKEDLDKALKNLVIDSQNNGFFRAKIISVRTLFNKDHDGVTIAINFDEGPLTQIQKISFEGNTQISEQLLLAQLKLKSLDPLKLNALEDGIENVKKFYRGQGFLDMYLVNEKNEKEALVSYNEDNTLANLKFKIFEGPKVYVGSVVVEGNTLTKDYVVLKELEFKPGDVLTPANVDESIARLQRLGIFNSVDIKTLEEKTMVSRRTVLVKVSDRNPGLVNAGMGYTSELRGTVRGYVGYAYRNFGGLARTFSARADLDENVTDPRLTGFLEKRATVGYLQPYLNDSRMKGRASLTNATFVSDYSKYSAEDVWQVILSLEEEITSHLLVRWDLWNWSRTQDSQIGQTPQDPTLIGSTGPIIELDYRDNPLNPTKGTFTRLNLEYGAPGLLQSSPPVNFERGVLAFTDTMTIYKKVVWANHFRGGYLKNLEDPNQGGYTPWLQKGFLLGGPTTIRGFTAQEAFPNLTDLLGKNATATNFPLTTDASMYLVKSELRIPIKGSFGTLLFYDGGAVTISGFNYGFSYRHSVGVGAYYNTPVGPASVDIGWKLNQIGSRGESPLALDLSIGTF